MKQDHQRGQANLTGVLLVVGLIVAGVWVWKRLAPETQDQIVEQGVPIGALVLGIGAGILFLIKNIRRRRQWRERRDRLMAKFERETSVDKKRDLAFVLIEWNEYRLEGLERVAGAMAEVFAETLKSALGDKQHRTRGMAASHLGVLQAKEAVPLLLKALEDDHAYVRGCAALALGRMREGSAKAKLEGVMRDDWDQTVRSRAREALERIG